QVHVVGQILPDTRDAWHLSLTAELAFGADLARHARHFRSERAELVHHRVDGVLELQDLPADIDFDLLRQIACGDGGGDIGDVAALPGQVRSQRVHVVGQIFPGACDAGHARLTAEPAFGTDLA